MFTEIKHTLRRMRGAIIGWGIGLFAYGLMMAKFFTSLEMMEGFLDNLENYPAEMLAFFPNIYDIMSPKGYMDTYFFSYMTLIIGFFAVTACANLLVGDEEKGILDLLVSYPVSRSGFFWGRLIGFLIATVMILLARLAGLAASCWEFRIGPQCYRAAATIHPVVYGPGALWCHGTAAQHAASGRLEWPPAWRVGCCW